MYGGSGVKKIAFICVQNSCRSQIAEALCRASAGDLLDPYSAGTFPASSINSSALRLMKSFYDTDMANQRPKPLSELPEMDIIVTMGCEVSCPLVHSSQKISWHIENPDGKSDEEFLAIIRIIQDHVRRLPKLVAL